MEKRTNDNPEPAQVKKSRRWLWLTASLFLVLVLATAAFLGGRYLQNGLNAIGGGRFLSFNGPGVRVQHIISKNDIIPAPELPKIGADATGVFLRRQDNSFFIGTGNVTIHIGGGGPNGTSQVGSSYDGPVVEVVVTNNTKIYRDNTFQNEPKLPSGSKIQQKVVPGSLDEISKTSMINVWGKKTGDRLVANVLLYNNN